MLGRKFSRAVRSYIVAAVVIVTATTLIFAIYFTEASLPWWTAFLTGILVAAILAEAVRSSRSEWVVMRRTAQVAALKDKLKHEAYLRKSADKKIAYWQSRSQLVDDVISTMVVLVDTDSHCRYHNRAFRDWLHMRKEMVDGRHLREVIGFKTYAEIATAIRQSLDGQNVQYQRIQQASDGVESRLSVTHIPQFDPANRVTGFYMLIDNMTAINNLTGSENPQT